jgi:hypothetical protein
VSARRIVTVGDVDSLVRRALGGNRQNGDAGRLGWTRRRREGDRDTSIEEDGAVVLRGANSWAFG